MMALVVPVLAVGCELPALGARPALPTALPTAVPAEARRVTTVVSSNRAKTERTPGPTSTPAPLATALPPTPRPPIKAVSHSVEGREKCMGCHSSPRLPAPPDHAGRPDSTCLGCHKVSASVPRPAAAGTAVGPGGGVRTGPAGTFAHSVEGREGCLLCHMRGTDGARPVPGDHGGRLNNTCLSCHRQR